MIRTLTLDADVAKLLDRTSKDRGASPDELANELLRRSLPAGRPDAVLPGRPYRMKTSPGRQLVANLDNIGRVLAFLDNEAQD